MKAILTVWLQVCLYVSLSAGVASNLSAAGAAAAGDVPARVTSANAGHRIFGSTVVTRNQIDILELASG